MCLKCDGYSDEEIARGVELLIATNGWMVQAVAPGDGPNADKGFAYTVGLTKSFGLPELVVMDTPQVESHAIISRTIAHLREGGTFSNLKQFGIDWVTVHEELLDSDLFGTHVRHYGAPPTWVVQLIPPDYTRCAGCAPELRTDLSDPNTRHPYSDDEW